MFHLITKVKRLFHLTHKGCVNYSKAISPISQHKLSQKYTYFVDEIKYFEENEKYTIFDINNKNLYQFDDLSGAVIVSNVFQMPSHSNWKNSSINCSNEELIKCFQNVLTYCIDENISLSSEDFDKFLDKLTHQLNQFSTNELICALQIFAKLQLLLKDRFPNKIRNYAELFIAFDQACTIKANDWNINQLLYVCSIWCRIGNARKSFLAKFFGRLFDRKAKTMNAQQVAESIFYMLHLDRQIEDIRKFENIFYKNIDSMTMEELSILCRHFVQIDAKIEKPELRRKMFEILQNHDFNQFNETLLISILLITQKMVQSSDAPTLEVFVQNLTNSLDSYSLRTCIILANIGSKLNLYNTKLIEYTLQRCSNEAEHFVDLRMTDLENLSIIISKFNFTTESRIEINVANLILTELRNRLSEVTNYTHHLHIIKILENLSYINVYDIELIENILNPNYIEFIYGNNKILEQSIRILDGYARINLNEIYTGHLLNDKYLEKSGTFQTNYIPKKQLRKREDFIIQVENTLAKLFKYYNYANAVAHNKYSDIFVGIDIDTMENIDVTENFPPLYTGKNITAQSIKGDKSNLEIFAFISASRKMLVSGTNRYTGVLQQKYDQLRLLGFNPIVISYPAWIEQTEREKFIRDKLDQKCKEIQLQ